MEILGRLHEIALQKYPTGIECFDICYNLNPQFVELTKIIADGRNKFSIEEVCEKLRKNFENYHFRDTTYLYNTNPCIRIELMYNKKVSKILISLLYPIFSIIGEFKKETSKVKSVLSSYTFLDDCDLKGIRINTISANQKLMKDTTLFDCFFHDN